jgi:hypothetical protein
MSESEFTEIQEIRNLTSPDEMTIRVDGMRLEFPDGRVFSDLTAVLNREAVARMLGFTWGDVDALIYAFESFSPPEHYFSGYNDTVAPLRGIADRIAALLPPREEA